jgi:acyl-CoA thioesterase II
VRHDASVIIPPPVFTLSQILDTFNLHRPPELSDWLLYEHYSANGIGGRGLAQGTMYNRSGELVCTTMLEGYFGRRPQG